MFYEDVIIMWYSSVIPADVEVESEDSIMGLAHFKDGGNHPVIWQDPCGGLHPRWWPVVRYAPGTIVGQRWNATSRRWEDGTGFDAPPIEEYRPTRDQLPAISRDSMTFSDLQQDGESDSAYDIRTRERIVKIARRLAIPYDDSLMSEAIAYCKALRR